MSWDVLQGRRKKRQKPWRQKVSRQPRLDKLQRGTKLPRWLLTVCCSTQTGNMGRIFLVSYPILHLVYIGWCAFVCFFEKGSCLGSYIGYMISLWKQIRNRRKECLHLFIIEKKPKSLFRTLPGFLEKVIFWNFTTLKRIVSFYCLKTVQYCPYRFTWP